MSDKTIVISEIVDGTPSWWKKIIAKINRQKYVYDKEDNTWLLKTLLSGHIHGSNFFPDDINYDAIPLWYPKSNATPYAEIKPTACAVPINCNLLRPRDVHVKIVLTNMAEEKASIELFNKLNGLDISPVCIGMCNISCEVITDKGTQSYSDFFDSLLDVEIIIISNIKTSDNTRFKFFLKDIVYGKRPITPDMFDQPKILSGRSPMQIDLLPKEKFEIDFDITAMKRNGSYFDTMENYN